MLKLQYQPVPDFEELLTNDPENYAQVCWSLANHSDERGVELGATITIGVPCEEHGQHDYEYRLTEISLLNIGHCQDVDTCDEAIRLLT